MFTLGDSFDEEEEDELEQAEAVNLHHVVNMMDQSQRDTSHNNQSEDSTSQHSNQSPTSTSRRATLQPKLKLSLPPEHQVILDDGQSEFPTSRDNQSQSSYDSNQSQRSTSYDNNQSQPSTSYDGNQSQLTTSQDDNQSQQPSVSPATPRGRSKNIPLLHHVTLTAVQSAGTMHSRPSPIGESRPPSFRPRIDDLSLESALLQAVAQGDEPTVVQLLQDHVTNPECLPLAASPVGPLGITALHAAAFLHPELVHTLLAMGADPLAFDKLGRSPLHLACTAGHDECVVVLLKAGADPNLQMRLSPKSKDSLLAEQRRAWTETLTSSKSSSSLQDQADGGRGRTLPRPSKSTNSVLVECEVANELPVPDCLGRTPLHQAVKGNHPSCVALLLEHTPEPARVDDRDQNENTALLLAGAGVEPEDEAAVEKYEEVVRLLVQAGADVLARLPSGYTPLHHAAARCSSKAARLLMNRGAEVTPDRTANILLMATTKEGDTPLHEAAHHGAEQVLAALLEIPASQLLINVANVSGYSPLHRAAFSGARGCLALLIRKGGNLAARTTAGTPVLEATLMNIAKPAHFIKELLDEAVTTNEAPVVDQSFKVHMNFSLLAPSGCLRQTAVLRGLLGWPRGSGHRQLLEHPLLETFLRLKWQRLRIFFFMLVATYLMFIFSLSGYVISAHLPRNNCTAKREEDLDYCFPDGKRKPNLDPNKGSVVAFQVLLTIFASIIFVQETLQSLLMPAYYLKAYETWIILLSTILSIIIGNAPYEYSTENSHKYLTDVGFANFPPWVIYLTCIALLLAWTELLFLIGRFPSWGNHALMFYTVLHNVFKVLVIFISIIFGFALCFFVQYTKLPLFNDPWRSFVKTIIMMTGEFEYNNIFDDSVDDINGNPGFGQVIIVIFVIVVTIVLMNLMIGVAVSDIREIQAKGHFSRLLKQAEFVDHIEIFVTHGMFKFTLPKVLIHIVETLRKTEIVLTIQPSAIEKKLKRPHNLPHRLIEACVELAVKRRAKLAEKGKRSSWYEFEMEQAEEMGLKLENLLLNISTEIRELRELVLQNKGEKEQESEPEVVTDRIEKRVSPSQLRARPRKWEGSPKSVRSPGLSRFSRRDVVSEMQGAQVVLRRLWGERAFKSDWK